MQTSFNQTQNTNFGGLTALHFAAYYGDIEITKILISHGADLTIKDNNDYTAYDVACRFQFWDLAKYIKQMQNEKLIVE